MRVVDRLALGFLDGETPGDDDSGSRAERVEVGLGGVGAHAELGEGLAVNFYGDLVSALGQLDLGAERKAGEQNRQGLSNHVRH